MSHAGFIVNLVALWLVIQTSAMMIADKLNVEELRKQLHDPTKERIDLDCDACVLMVDVIQFLVRQNANEEEIAKAATELCIQLKIEDKSVCTQGVQEFKVN